MATEVKYVNYKDFVADLESTENPGVDDVTVVSNSTDGPRTIPANTSALTNTATDSDLTADASFELQTATGKKKAPANLLARQSALESTNGDVTALTTYAQNVASSIAPSMDDGDYDALDIVMDESGKAKMFDKEHDAGDELSVGELTDISLSNVLKYLINNSNKTITFVDDVNNFTRVTDKLYADDGEHSSEYWQYYYKEVSAGERYAINTFCQRVAQCWFMLDNEDNVVKSSGVLPGSDIVESNADILIPHGVSKLIVNNRSDAAYAAAFFIKKSKFAGRTVSSDTSSKILSLDTNGVMQCINLIRELGLNFEFMPDSVDWTKNENYFINSTKDTYSEGLTSNSNYDVYEIVGVASGDKYKVKAVAGSAARLWTIYDASGNRIARSPDYSDFSVKEEEVVIPDGAYRICVNARKISGDISPVFKKYFAFLPEKKVDVDNSVYPTSVNDILRVFDRYKGAVKNINLISELGLSFEFVSDSADWTKNENYFINSSKDTYSEGLTSNSNYDVYEIVGVANGDKYKVKAVAGSVARLWTIYDASGNRIARSSDSSDFSVKEEEVAIPTGAYRICVNARKASGDISPVLKKYFAFLPANRINSGDSNNVNDKLWGKTIVFCGDSITRGGAIGDGGTTDDPAVPTYIRSGNSFNRVSSGVIKSYAYQIAARHAMTYYNDGISGSTMQGMQENSGFSLENGRYTTLPNNIDYLVIFFGWNDTAYGTLGAINDSTNESFYGGYNVVLPYLINKYPYAKICLVVPYGTDEGHRNAVRLLANKWGVSCFDMYGPGTPLFYGKESSVGVDPSLINPNKAKFTTDNTHPNVLGHKQIADMLEQHLMGI